MSSKKKTPKLGPPRRDPRIADSQSRSRATSGVVPGPRHPRALQDFEPFHSAVNRIPVPRDENAREISEGKLPDFIGDSTPPPLDHLHPDLWSGSIDVEMTVRTPLVFGAQKENNVSLPRDADGAVLVSPTMAKGMISRAYEVLTASRFRVFDGHDKPLTYRADPAMANGLVPGRVHCHPFTTYDGQEHLQYEVETLDGTGKNGTRTALLVDTESDDFIAGGLDLLRRATPHGQQVRVGLSRRGTQLFVTHVSEPDSEDLTQVLTLKPKKDRKGKTHPVKFLTEVTGYPCRTAPDEASASDLFNEKKYERFFFKVTPTKTSTSGDCKVLSRDHLSAYTRVVESYVSQHEEPGQGEHLLNRAALASSRCVRDGDLVFVRLDSDDNVVEILPTMVGRRSYEASPRYLAANQRVLPVARADEASSADRLFGYVVDAPADEASGGDVAARGRLFFGAVDTSEVTVSTQQRTLVPLLSPKPSSARRFLTDVQPRQGEKEPRRSDHFRKGQRLGAAAYPVHRMALGKNFPAEATTAFVATPGEENAKTTLTAKDWVVTGSVMRTRIRFEGLSKDELAALLWVLTPENLVPAGEQGSGRVGYLRMGLGKPLGLGVVEVRATGIRVVSSNDLASDYASLSGALGTAERTHRISDFRLPFNPSVLPWVKAMQRAAYGYDDNIPVRYMSLEENKANNQTNSKTGAVQQGRGLAPVPLEEKPHRLEIPKPSDK